MPKEKARALNHILLEQYAKLDEHLEITPQRHLYCSVCSTNVSADKRSHVTQHLNSFLHKSHAKLVEKRPGANATTTPEVSQEEFMGGVCNLFATLDIPWKKSADPSLRHFFVKFVRRPIPDEASLRKCFYMKDYSKAINSIRKELEDCYLYVVVTEGQAPKDFYSFNVFLGGLSVDRARHPHLIAVRQLERIEDGTIAQCVHDSISSILPEKSSKDRILLVTVSNPILKKEIGQGLLRLCPKAILVSCLVNDLEGTCEHVRHAFPLAKKWISYIAEASSKYPRWSLVYRDTNPNLPFPPPQDPCKASSWIETCSFLASHFDGIKKAILRIEIEDEDVQRAIDPSEDSLISQELVDISNRYGSLPSKFKSLQNSKLSLIETFDILDEIKNTMSFSQDERSLQIDRKLRRVLEKNENLPLLENIGKILVGNLSAVKTKEVMTRLQTNEIMALKYAKLTCDYQLFHNDGRSLAEDVERSSILEHFQTVTIDDD